MFNACLITFCASFAALEGLPVPQELELERNNVFQIMTNTPVVMERPPATAEARVLDMLFDAAGEDLSLRHGVVKPLDGATIYIGVYDQLAVFRHRKLKRFIEMTQDLPPEGYTLYIEKKQVVLVGKDRAGLFHGLNTLTAIARQYPGRWPCLQMRDWPDIPLRGLRVEAPLSTNQLDALAASHANCVLIDQPAWDYLSGAEADRYARFYQAARERYIEPIPMAPVLDRAQAMLQHAPATVEGRVAHDKLILKNDDYNVLSQRHVIQTKDSPVLVTLNGRICKEGKDYLFEAPVLEYPLPALSIPWMIRRIPGGAIPNGAAVQISYSYIPTDASGWCPQAPEGKEAFSTSLNLLEKAFSPTLLHLGHGWTERLAMDTRCILAGEDALSTSLITAGKTATAESDVKLLLFWADLFDPLQHGYRFDRTTDLKNIPTKLLPLLRLVSDRDQSAQQWRWMRAQSRPWMACIPAQPEISGGLLSTLEETDKLRGVLLDGDPVAQGTRALLLQSWCGANRPGIWPETLNAYFGANLQQPSFEERLTALIDYINRRSVAGIPPDRVEEEFKVYHKILEKAYGKDHPELSRVARQFDHLLRYLSLEHEYRVEGKVRARDRLPSLVEDQAELDPEFTEERVERILTTLATQELFVPAPILFRQPLAYYRDPKGMRGKDVYPLRVKPVYTDAPFTVEAECDLLAAVGKICRIDFETVHAKSLELLYTKGDEGVKPVHSWRGNDLQVLSSPLLMSNAAARSHYTLRLQSSAERAVLRELRLYAVKETAEARCAAIAQRNSAQELDSLLAKPAQAVGFLRLGQQSFAEAPTNVWICRAAAQLFVVFQAYDPRMYALNAEATARDTKLWEEESVELLLKNSDGTPFQFLVNPLGAQFDSKDWDAAWDADWTVSVEREDERWTAILAIPFKALEDSPKRGDQWAINFKRHRANVTNETSAWAHDYTQGHGYQYGVLRFD